METNQSFHLIIDTDDSDNPTACRLGYCHPVTKQYAVHVLNQDSETDIDLFNLAGELFRTLKNNRDENGNKLSHHVTRQHEPLAALKTILTSLGVETQRQLSTHRLSVKKPLALIEDYIKKEGWSWEDGPRLDFWYTQFFHALRTSPTGFWPSWMSKDFPWGDSDSAYRDFIMDAKNCSVDKNYRGQHILPVSFSLGDARPLARERTARGSRSRRVGAGSVGSCTLPILKSMIEAWTQKEANLKNALNTPWITSSVQLAI